MTKYHINDEGDIGRCVAQDGSCPYVHATDISTARELAEDILENKYGNFSNSIRSSAVASVDDNDVEPDWDNEPFRTLSFDSKNLLDSAVNEGDWIQYRGDGYRVESIEWNFIFEEYNVKTYSGEELYISYDETVNGEGTVKLQKLPDTPTQSEFAESITTPNDFYENVRSGDWISIDGKPVKVDSYSYNSYNYGYDVVDTDGNEFSIDEYKFIHSSDNTDGVWIVPKY